MKNISLFFGFLLFFCTTLWLLLDKCSGRSAPESSEKNKIVADQDSIIKSHKFIEQNLKNSYAQQQQIKNSILKKLGHVEELLDKQQKSTLQTAERVKTSAEKKDTSQQLNVCNELVDQAIALSEQVDVYKSQNDSLRVVNDSLQSIAGQQLQDQVNLNAGLVRSFDRLKKDYDEQAAAYQKSVNRNNRKYTVAIGGGGGYTTEGKPAGMIGIFIGRELFKF